MKKKTENKKYNSSHFRCFFHESFAGECCFESRWISCTLYPRDARSVPRAGWQGEGAGVRGERHVRYELLLTIILTNASQVPNENIRLKMSKGGKLSNSIKMTSVTAAVLHSCKKTKLVSMLIVQYVSLQYVWGKFKELTVASLTLPKLNLLYFMHFAPLIKHYLRDAHPSCYKS